METKNVYSFRLSKSDIALIDSMEKPQGRYFWREPTRTEKLEQILYEYREFKKKENQATK
jgi:hypothetical protein